MANRQYKHQIDSLYTIYMVLRSINKYLCTINQFSSRDQRRPTPAIAIDRMLEAQSLSYVDGPVPIPADNLFLLENVKRIQICDTDEWVENHKVLLFWQVKPVVHVFQLSEDGPGEEPGEDDTL